MGINVDRACHCTVGPEESGAGMWVTARPVPRAVVDWWWWWWVDGLLGRWGEGLGSRGGFEFDAAAACRGVGLASGWPGGDGPRSPAFSFDRRSLNNSGSVEIRPCKLRK